MKTFFENRQIRHSPRDLAAVSEAAGNAGSTAVQAAFTLGSSPE